MSPLMGGLQQSEQDDAGSVAYNHQVWRVDRNEKIVQQVGPQALKAAHRQWTKPVKSIQTGGCPLYMAMHAYDPHLVTANESDVIRYIFCPYASRDIC